MRVVIGDDLRDMICPMPPVHYLLGLLAFSEAYELGQMGPEL